MKKVLSLFLSMLILTSVVAAVDLSALAATSGTCGSNLTWELDDEGTLTISGTGDMKNYYTTSSVPWYSNRSSIENVEINSGVTSIGDSAFYWCANLTSVTIPDSVTNIGDDAFEQCYSLTSVTIGNGVTSIGDSAFDSCTSLTSITIPDSVTSIGFYAFGMCSSLTSITIPDSVTSIGDGTFEKCTSLTSITVGSNNAYYSSEDGILFNKDKTALVCYPAGKSGAYTIPNSVTSIVDYAFSTCESLTSITIPNSVTSIGGSAFRECKSLTSITIPDSVTSIGDRAFWGCTSLTSITIGNSVTSIGYYAFYCCESLTDVYYGGSESDWNKIDIGEYNEILECVTIHCSDGDIAQSHTWNVTTKADCEYNGSQTCTVCGAVESIPSLGGHTWDNGTVTKAATCSSMGTMKYTCTACGATKTETIAATGNHTYKNVITKATTSKNGKITPTCSVCGATKSSTTTIYKIKSMSLSTSSYTYNGKAKKPSVTVKDSKGNKISSKYYTVSYISQSTGKKVSSMKNPGKYYVKVTFKTRYSGSIKKAVTIKPKKTSIKSIKASKKGFTVKWGKVSTQNTGYQIQYSTSKSFKNAKTATVKKTGTTSKKVTKLKAKKKYYVRVRTYKTVKINGKSTKIYSAWSSTKGVTTKK